jgi:predicted membrane-bound dolichyl-phosphate-mannose-protein mannosyltransferase
MVGLFPAAGHARLLWRVLVIALVTRAVSLARPDGALILDEKYYVNAARVILGIAAPADTYGDHPKGLDPNTEHPPLAKILVAGSMAVLGDNLYGWRLPSVLLGMASVLLTYGISRRLAAPEVAATPRCWRWITSPSSTAGSSFSTSSSSA